jgi:hypothetical protein
MEAQGIHTDLTRAGRGNSPRGLTPAIQTRILAEWVASMIPECEGGAGTCQGFTNR